ncbi:MAG: mismatch-specific DNA-glycosylase, partial [Acidimicrobiia bacterium]|nr:mismatch-specific DNA-glycosylase [Acidimicrobiia bacterium]
ELREGGAALVDNVEAWRPRVVAVSGITAYRTAFGRTRSSLGQQDERMGDTALWVVPNPSGLNAHETIDSLADWFILVGQAAGLLPKS